MDKLMRFNPEPFGPELEFQGFHHDGGSSSEFEEEYRGRRGYAKTPAAQFARQGMSLRSSFRQPFRPQIRRPAPGFPAALRHGQGTVPKRHFHRRRHYRPGDAQWLRDPASSIEPSGRAPSRFVQWIQSSSNAALGLRLPVDGIMSASVRGAIRLFQERNGLPVTGSVDAQTEFVFKQAGDSGGAAAPSGPGPVSAPAPTDDPAPADEPDNSRRRLPTQQPDRASSKPNSTCITRPAPTTDRLPSQGSRAIAATGKSRPDCAERVHPLEQR